ncbi:MAG: glycosyltransferase family 39 protein [Chloroflexaceae bacterium]|nr:glycosyltransferase family 39 protein [Chloroflexaceae bacterium]
MHGTRPVSALREAAPPRSVSQVRGSFTVLIVFILFLLALAPRLLAMGDFWTADEADHWSERVEAFWPALQQGHYAETNMVGHPGVTTMWLGSVGLLMQRTLETTGWIPPDDPALYRMFLRVPIAIVSALWVALAYPLMRRLFGARVALLAALLWAGDPFLVAHGKILHVDALLTSFITLSLLAAMVAFRLETRSPPALPDPRSHHHPLNLALRTIRWDMLVVSGAMAGLALLTKSPSMILVPLVGLAALVGAMRKRANDETPLLHYLTRSPHRLVISRLPVVFLPLAVWGGVAATVWVALWPAAWVDPVGSAMTIVNEVFRNGAVKHGWGNFFLGHPVADPGPLFYPVAIVLRLTPWATLGLVAAGVAVVVAFWQRNAAKEGTQTNDRWSAIEGLSPALALLLLFALLFIAIMSILPKKFDRYALPTFPVLDLVAAIGVLRVVDLACLWWQHRTRTTIPGSPRTDSRSGMVTWALVVIGLSINLLWYHPYELAYYNPLVGGGPVASRAILVGWGEGFEQAGHYITRQYNGCDLGVASWYKEVIQPYVCSPVLHLGYVGVPGHVHYAVLYSNQYQREIQFDILPSLRERGSLVHTVRIHGIDYAYVYQLRQPRQHRVTADFGSSIRLTGYDVITESVRSSEVLTLTLQWHVQEEMTEDYQLFLHVFDEAGNQVGQADVPPGGPFQPTSEWGYHRFIDWIHRIPVQSGASSGPFWVTLGIYDPATFVRLPLSHPPSPPPGAPNDGENALVLGPFMIPD